MKYLLLLLIAALSISANVPDRIELVLNCSNEPTLPRNFRMASHDMANLRASASGQFSQQGFYHLRKHLPDTQLFIVDLREESHIFINGHAVCWRTKHNSANQGKSHAAIEQDEAQRQNELLNIPCIVLEDSVIYPKAALSEKKLVEDTGCLYLRIPVTDHRPPSDEAVDQFISFYNNLPEHAWIHYHCSAGKGRSSTFMVMHDIMANGDKLTLKEILHRQAALGGKDFTLPTPTGSWKTQYAQERIHFIHRFYQYRQETQGLTPWSQWTKNLN